MSMRPLSEDDLHAFVDQALDTRRQAEVAAYLESHPEIAARSRTIASRPICGAALAPVTEEPVPPELDLGRMIADRRRRGAVVQWAAAAVVLVCLGGLGGWSLRGITEVPSAGLPSLALEAADSYSVFASDRAHAVEIAASDRADCCNGFPSNWDGKWPYPTLPHQAIVSWVGALWRPRMDRRRSSFMTMAGAGGSRCSAGRWRWTKTRP